MGPPSLSILPTNELCRSTLATLTPSASPPSSHPTVQALSMISILSTNFLFSTAVFMVKFMGAKDEAMAATHAGVLIAAKPVSSALSSYVWGAAADRVGFRNTMLISSALTALLTVAMGSVTAFHWAVVIRTVSGAVDGGMTLSKGCMAKISDKTNSARAFSTFGVTYGLGAAVAPTISAVLAYPCGGDPNSSRADGSSAVFGSCPASFLRDRPFFLSSGWVTGVGIGLWMYAYAFLKVPAPGTVGEEGVARGGGATGAGMEMAVMNREGDGEDLLPATATQSRVDTPKGERDDSTDDTSVSLATIFEEGSPGKVKWKEEEQNRGEEEGEEVVLLSPAIRNDDSNDDEEKGLGIVVASTAASAADDDKFGDGANVPWHKDQAIRLAIFNQVGCTFMILTGAELTPIWMATTRANGGLGFTAVDIGAFGSVMGFSILVFAATLFAVVVDRFGATRSCTCALFLNAVVYACHPFAVLALKKSRAGMWTLVSVFGVLRGCMGPVVMGGVSLILNNASPRNQLGAVNGFAGIFGNLARAGAPIFAGILIAGMVQGTRDLNGHHGSGIEKVLARDLNPTWWPFMFISLGLCVFGYTCSKLPRSLDNPRE